MSELTGSIRNGEFHILDRRDPSNTKIISCAQATKEDLIEYLWYLNIEPPNKNVTNAIKYNYINYDVVKLVVFRNFKYSVEHLTRKQIIFLYIWHHHLHTELCDYLKHRLEDLELLGETDVPSLSLDDEDEKKIPSVTITFPTISYRVNPNTIDADLIRTIIQDNPTDTEINLELYGKEFQWIIDQEIPRMRIPNENPEQVFQVLNYFGATQLRQQFLQELKIKILNQVKQDLVKEREALLEKHLDELDWRVLSRNPVLSENFFKKHINRVSVFDLAANPALPVSFFSRYIKKDASGSLSRNYYRSYALSENYALPEPYIEKHINGVENWRRLSANPALSEDFFERHLNLIDWYRLSANPAVSEDFLERHLNNVKLVELSRNPILSDDFIERHLDRVIWSVLSGNPALSEDLFEQHLDEVDWYELSKNPSMSEDFFERHLDKVRWKYLSRNPAMSEDFFKKHIDKVDWHGLAQNPALSEDFFEQYLNKFDADDWIRLSANPALSDDFFERHLDKVKWIDLMGNPSISAKFFERHGDQLLPEDWRALSGTGISDELILRTARNHYFYSFDKIMWKS